MALQLFLCGIGDDCESINDVTSANLHIHKSGMLNVFITIYQGFQRLKRLGCI